MRENGELIPKRKKILKDSNRDNPGQIEEIEKVEIEKVEIEKVEKVNIKTGTIQIFKTQASQGKMIRKDLF